MTTTDLVVEDGLPVQLPSGATFKVLTADEVAYVEDRARRYLEDNHFVNVSDFQDVDRMIILEVLCFRWGLFISNQRDYFGDVVDDTGSLRRALHDYSAELRQLKKMLGIDKNTRDKDKGEDSVSVYLENLRARAKEFGVTRERMFDKGMELFQQLRSLITLFDNCDEKERIEEHCTTEDIMDWIRTIAIPEFEEIDNHFRNTSQRSWIRSM